MDGDIRLPPTAATGKPSRLRLKRNDCTFTTAGETAVVAIRNNSEERATIPSLSSLARASEAACERPDSQA